MDRTTERELLRRARAAARQALAPASRFQVGAAVLARDGRLFSGCNVENPSYGLTICAERNATFHAVAEGAKELVAVAVYTPLARPGYPCGACLQVLAQFGAAMTVLLCGRGNRVVRTTLTRLLPHPFTFSFAPPRRGRRQGRP
jgi:cytidine deaminase